MLRIGIFISLERGRDRALVKGIAAFARTRPDWTMVLSPLPEDVRWSQRVLAEYDGLIVRIRTSALDRWLASRHARAINVSDVLQVKRLPYVGPDNHAVGRCIARHLLDLGYQHVAYYGELDKWHARSRLAGLTEALAAYGRDAPRLLGVPTDTSLRSLRSLRAALRKLAKSTALVAATDRLAITLCEACRQAGIRVPEDLALLGVNNDDLLCELARPTLSSVDIGAEQLGQAAAEMLDTWVRDATAQPPAMLAAPPEPRVVSRDSTGLAPDLDRHVAAALAFIRTRVGQGLAVDHVLEHVRISRTALDVRLKQAVGRTIHGEIAHQRLLHAQHLLLRTELPLGEVANRSGYSSQQRFSNVFSAAMKQTPLAYRRRRGLTEAVPGP